MGKNWDKSLDKAADRLGIDRGDDKYRTYNWARSDRGLGFSRDAYETDIIKTAANDYDTRRGLEAAAMAGDKKARKYAEGGIDSLKDVAKSYDVLAGLKKEHVGGGGMGGAKNKFGLTQALVDWDRETMLNSLDDKYGQKDAPEDPTEPVIEKADVVLSKHLERAKEVVNDWENNDQQVYADNSGALTQSTGIKQTEPPSDTPDPASVPTAVDLTDPDTFYKSKMAAYSDAFNLQPEF